MASDDTDSVPRQPEEPTPEQVLEEMSPCEPYTVSDFETIFDDVSRWTIQRRLATLHEEGEIQKKKHAENRVSWWISLGIPKDVGSEKADRRVEEHFDRIKSMLEDEISESSCE
jgi:predicted transcriptional regulator